MKLLAEIVLTKLYPNMAPKKVLNWWLILLGHEIGGLHPEINEENKTPEIHSALNSYTAAARFFDSGSRPPPLLAFVVVFRQLPNYWRARDSGHVPCFELVAIIVMYASLVQSTLFSRPGRRIIVHRHLLKGNIYAILTT